MEMFVKQSNEKANIILQRYVDNYKFIYGSYILWAWISVVVVVSGPIYLPDEFPTNAVYPFSVEHPLIKTRLELLTQNIRTVINENELNTCIKFHNEILRYTKEVISVITPMIFTTIMTTAMSVIFGSLYIITDQPLMVKLQYAAIVFTASMVLFACSLSADKLMHMSNRICLGAYESQWFKGSVSMQKKIIQILFRAQKPEVISITGMIPALTLRYYIGVRIMHFFKYVCIFIYIYTGRFRTTICP
ncbi:odorant receptor 30a isoform X2 [Solenopsis invicta]|uniref:odorant receptor 30a isoform X2 n=1 Tax=Solenopsis invicta TaxID=13686 RepID=UPI00193E7934|nr:odorant receptor 30a isoform X2 [Solenopsis invicta]